MTEENQSASNNGGEVQHEKQENKQETFTKEYVSELRDKVKSSKSKIAELEAKTKEELAKKDRDFEELLNSKLAEVSSTYKKEIILSKLQTEALKAGIVDVDGIKLADLSSLSIDENNVLQGASEVISSLKESKPYLFKKGESSTTYHKQPPKPSSDRTPVDATQLSGDEYRSQLKKMGIDPTKI
jgi:hypothetical protein